MRLFSCSTLLILCVLLACDKPCPKGQQRYGVKCVNSLLPEGGVPDTDGGRNDRDDGADGGACETGLFYRDADGDGFGVGLPMASCLGAGTAMRADDCDDANASVNPSGVERCNSQDDDCDETVDEGLGSECDSKACAALKCHANAECSLEGGQQRCKCTTGFEGDGKACSNIDECAAKPCKNAGICQDGVDAYTCDCTASFTGKHCELEICGDTLIRSKADLDANRLCAEVRGDLSIAASGNIAIAITDLPYLTKVTGDLAITSFLTGGPIMPLLQSVTFGALESVGMKLLIGPWAGEKGAAQPVHFPVLRSVGANHTAADAKGLEILQNSVTSLDFPMLTDVKGSVLVTSVFELCSANFRALSSVAGTVNVSYAPKLPPAHVQTMLSLGSQRQSDTVGCCVVEVGLGCEAGSYDRFSAACLCIGN